MSVPRGGGIVGGCPHPPGKSGIFFFAIWWGLFATFSPCGGLLCYVFLLMGGPFHHVRIPFHHMGAFLLLFSPCLGPFLSLWGAFFVLTPLRKFLLLYYM